MKNKNLFGALLTMAIAMTLAMTFVQAETGLKVTAEATEEERGIVLGMVVSEEVEEINMVGNKITRLIDASHVVPGDRLVYVTTVSNQSNQLAENVSIVNPVPKHTTYLEGSAKGKETTVTFSVDDAKNFERAENLTVTDENGNSRAANATDYTHIRWLMNTLSARAKEEVMFRVRLN